MEDSKRWMENKAKNFVDLVTSASTDTATDATSDGEKLGKSGGSEVPVQPRGQLPDKDDPLGWIQYFLTIIFAFISSKLGL